MPETEFDQTLLLVDEDVDFLKWASKHLEAPKLRILACDSSDKAVKVLEKTEVDVCIASMDVQPLVGFELLKRVRAINNEIIVVLTTGFPSNGEIIEATQLGAHDIIRKEALAFDLRIVAEQALDVAENRKSAAEEESESPSITLAPKGPNGTRIIGNSEVFREIFKIVGKVARTDAPVLVMGESGTGKELISTAIHNYSPRQKGELVAINCGAIPDNLLESELFGHEKGSFTGAVQRRIGRFEQCDGGTLFLDEIGEMPPHVQVRLLRVLQTGEFSRVGGNETLKCDTRIVAATNKDLASEVAEGNFREDLYYRLNVVEITLPPLRERKDDIKPLSDYFLEKIARRNGMATFILSAEGLSALEAHNWPGNVRELENTLTRSCALATSHILLADDIPITRGAKKNATDKQLLDRLIQVANLADDNPLLWIQAQLADHAMEKTDQDIKKAASLLGCSTLEFRKLLSGGQRDKSLEDAI